MQKNNIIQWQKVNSVMMHLQDKTAENIISHITEYLFALKTEEKKKHYDYLYKIGKRCGLTVDDFVAYYCT